MAFLLAVFNPSVIYPGHFVYTMRVQQARKLAVTFPTSYYVNAANSFLLRVNP